MAKLMRLWTGVMIILALALLPGMAAAADAVQNRPEALNRVVEVRTSVNVRNITPDAAKNLRIIIPPTVMDRNGVQRVLAVKFLNNPTETRETPAGVEATYLVAEVPGGANLTFEQVYTVELLGRAEPIIEAQVDNGYLVAEAGIEADNAQIRAKALAVTAGLTSTEAKAEAIIRFVTNHLTYDVNAASRNKGALAGFEAGIGVCQEYAGLFVAMSRAAGVPARLVYGWARDIGLEGKLGGENRHVWAEYYDAEKGWIAVDPTFAEGQANLLAFDAQNHVAQNWTNATYSANFGGRGILTIGVNQTLTDLTTAKR